MKKIPLLILFVILFKFSNAQNLVGRWQADSAKFNQDTENYQLLADGTFCFNTDGDDGLTRVSKIVGSYKIDGAELTFLPSYYVEVSGGSLIFSSEKPGTGSWEFDDTKEKKVEVKKSKQHAAFKYYTKDNVEILDIDGTKYYKVQSDPGKY